MLAGLGCGNSSQCEQHSDCDGDTPYCSDNACVESIDDPLAPVVNSVATNTYDEREFGVGFKASTYEPCLFRAEGAGLGSVFGNGATEPPTVFKYASNIGAAPLVSECTADWEAGGEAPAPGYVRDSTANPIALLFIISDDVDGGAVTVTFQYKAPGGDLSPAEPLPVPTISGANGATHGLTLTSDVAPDLATTEGLWEVHVTATDRSLNKAVTVVTFDLQLLAGPLFVRDLGLDGTFPDDLRPITENPLKEFGEFEPGAEVGAVLARYRVHNGTPFPAYVRPEIASAGSAEWSSSTFRKQVEHGRWVVGSSPDCAAGQVFEFNIVGSPANACLSWPEGPAPASTSHGDTESDILGGFSVRSLLDIDTPSAECEGCPSGTYNLASGASLEVFALSKPLGFVWPEPEAPRDFKVGGKQHYGTSTTVFGQYCPLPQSNFGGQRFANIVYLDDVVIVPTGATAALTSHHNLSAVSARLPWGAELSAVPQSSIDYYEDSSLTSASTCN